MLIEDLIRKIEDAFVDVEYPGDNNLANSHYGDEPAALRMEFSGKDDWRCLESAFLDRAPARLACSLAFFSAEAFRFYLPAYLIADIRGKLEWQDPSTRLCMSLTPQSDPIKIAKVWGGGTLGEHARRDFELFNEAQVSAVVAYLWWKLETHDYNPTIEQALEHYWLERESAES